MSLKNELFEKIFQCQKLVDKLDKDGIIKKAIKLPNICAIGCINSGKSSTFESILNLNILPIGSDRKTIRPIEININHIELGEPYVIFENKKFEDFSKLKENIEDYFYEEQKK